jgi:hypothetical protein
MACALSLACDGDGDTTPTIVSAVTRATAHREPDLCTERFMAGRSVTTVARAGDSSLCCVVASSRRLSLIVCWSTANNWIVVVARMTTSTHDYR